MAALRLLLVGVLAALASAQLGASWPASPLAKGSEPRASGGVPVERAASVRLDASASRRRLSAEEDSERDIYLIMLWSGIGLVFIGYFSMSALFRMEVENDALLYSKVRGVPLSPAERPARAPLPPRPAAPPGAALGPSARSRRPFPAPRRGRLPLPPRDARSPPRRTPHPRSQAKVD